MLTIWHEDYFIFYLNRTGNVEALLHAGDVELDHSQVFAFDYDASQRPHKSEREVEDFIQEVSRQNDCHGKDTKAQC